MLKTFIKFNNKEFRIFTMDSALKIIHYIRANVSIDEI